MKKIYQIFCLLILFYVANSQTAPSLHSFTVNTIKGKPISMSQFAGKKILIVNTASYCMYTPQFAALQLLYKNYNQYDFEIVGFPCNDFGEQDPYSDSIINSFCVNSYSVTFPMMSKVKIAVGDTAPIYKWLQRANLNGRFNTSVAWNFGKFLINESGQLVKYYPSANNPADTAFTNWILSPSSTLGINELKRNSEFFELVSANPVDNSLALLFKHTSESCKVSLYSIEGRLVKDILDRKVSEGENLPAMFQMLVQAFIF